MDPSSSAAPTEDRLKELKENYVKLFADSVLGKKHPLPTEQVQLNFKRSAISSSSYKIHQEDKKSKEIYSSKTFWNDPNFRLAASTAPKLKPQLEELYTKSTVEKRNFMLERMDELSLSKPTKIMDYIKKQYPGNIESSDNTFFLLGDVHRCIREYLVAKGWIEKYCKDIEGVVDICKNHCRKIIIMGDLNACTGSDVRRAQGVTGHRALEEVINRSGEFCTNFLIGNSFYPHKKSGQDERTHLVRSLQGMPTGNNRTLENLMASGPVKFIWVNGFINWSLINSNVIVSRIPSSSYYFSKTALNSSIRELLPFFYQKGYIQVKTPKTYEIRSPEDMKHFVRQYRLNACISLIKNFVDSFELFPSQILHEDGAVPLDSLDFAIQRIVELIRYQQHADLDEWHFSVVSDEEWAVFLFRFYDIIHQDAKFQSKNHSMNIPKLYHACEKLCNIYEKVFPDTKHDGHRNLWIVKPSNGSCGRGVKLFKRLSDIQQHCKETNSYVIQKYIEVPLLIYETKFDIRQWFLITSVYPLIIWMYDECYLRFCSQQFSLTNVHESVHLCNNSVQYKYKNGVRSQQLPEDNMWADGTFQKYLSLRGNSEAWPAIKDKMRQAIIASCLVSQDKMYHRTNSFHLYGADFMLTADYDVWLIEINTHPSMKYSTSVTSRMCKEVLQDTLKVGLERRSNLLADTGKFVEIYRQQSHTPTVGVPASTAGVSTRKIRLLNQTLPRDVSSIKPLKEICNANSKSLKSLSYGNIATYKKRNKVNFKHIVLSHTDMPLDPGDSISQRDIGYSGVLDKTEINESLSSDENEDNFAGKEQEKYKNEMTLGKALLKPTNQITLHKKITTKLKPKEKQASDNNNEGNIKTQINELALINSYSISGVIQNESSFSNKGRKTQRTNPILSEVTQEMGSITESVKEKTIDLEKQINSENQETDVTNPKKADTEKNSLKVKRITSPEERKLVTSKKKSNTKSQVKSEKIENSSKVISLKNKPISQKGNNSRKIEIEAYTANQQKNNLVKNIVKITNLTRKDNNSKIYNTEGNKKEVHAKNMKKRTSKTYIQMEGENSVETIKNKSGSKANNKTRRSYGTSAISKSEIQKNYSRKKNTLKMTAKCLSNKVPQVSQALYEAKEKKNLSSDNTKQKTENSNFSAIQRSSVKKERPKGNPKVSGEIANETVKIEPDILIKGDGSKEVSLQQASIPHLMFLMSDSSEISFQIASDASQNDENSTMSMDEPLHHALNETEIENATSGTRFRTKNHEQRKNISTIKTIHYHK